MESRLPAEFSVNPASRSVRMFGGNRFCRKQDTGQARIPAIGKAIAEMTVNTAKRKRGIFTEKEGDSCFCGTDGKHRKNQKSEGPFLAKTGLQRRMDEADRRMAHYYRYVVVITGR